MPILLSAVLWLLLFLIPNSSHEHSADSSNGTPDEPLEKHMQCTPNRLYCGDQLESWLFYAKLFPKHHRNMVLFKCRNDGILAHAVDTCQWGCAAKVDGDAFCKCNANQPICGHSLNDMGWHMDAKNTLHRCSEDGLNVTQLISCPNGICKSQPREHCPCIPDHNYCGSELYLMGFDQFRINSCDKHSHLKSNNSYLFQCIAESVIKQVAECEACSIQQNGSYCPCLANVSYCGSKLHSMGWNGLENDTLYQCQTGLKNAKEIFRCPVGCNSDRCSCIPNHTYCGYELDRIPGWLIKPSDYHVLHRCVHGSEANFNVSCKHCIAKNGNSYCACTPGSQYCDSELSLNGWVGLENNTLYHCKIDGNDITKEMSCGEETCENQWCKCIPGKLYCSHELINMGWRLAMPLVDHSLYWCSYASRAEWIARCQNCHRKEGHAYCQTCTGPYRYCGSELDPSGKFYNASLLYICEYASQHPSVKTCRNCIERRGHSFCEGECTPGNIDCGSTLLTMGWSDLDSDTLYNCSADGLNITDTDEKDADCSSRHCIPGRTYCGYELQHKMNITPGKFNSLYKCDNSFNLSILHNCWSCISRLKNSYCLCVSGDSYCGKTFNEILGYQNLENDTLYLCQGGNPAPIGQCLEGECLTDNFIKIGYCPCIPGKFYCGHDNFLYQERHGKKYLAQNVLHQCNNDKRLQKFEECKGSCIPKEPARCQQTCVINQHYCGIQLQVLEGWGDQSLDSNTLYQCMDSITAKFLQNCSFGCQPTEGADSSCMGEPIAWYWWFMTGTLPLLFIVLLSILVYTIIKMTRLSKFLRQRRIDANQLTLVEKLGAGAFGEVWLGMYQISKKEAIDVALKISQHHQGDKTVEGLAQADAFFQESVAMEFLRHKNITIAYGICSNFKPDGRCTASVLVLEYMNGGSAEQYILQEKRRLTLADVKKITIGICEACKHLSKMGVIHRDIGARNVLVRKNPETGKPVIAKLNDFGLAKDVGNGTNGYKVVNPDRARFHFRYTAPEGFDGQFSSKSDVWSFGVFMWELYWLMDPLVKYPPVPFHMLDTGDEVLEAIKNGKRLCQPRFGSIDLYEWMMKCWAFEAEDRPSFEQLLRALSSKTTNSVTTTNENINCPQEASLPGPSLSMNSNTETENNQPNTSAKSTRVFGSRCSGALSDKGIYPDAAKKEAAPEQIITSECDPAAVYSATEIGRAFETVACDAITCSSNEMKYAILFTDCMTKYCVAISLQKITGKTIADAFFKSVVLCHGSPTVLLTDFEDHLNTDLQNEITQLCNAVNDFATMNLLQINKKIGVYNETLANRISKYANEHENDWDEYLPYLVYAYNNSTHEASILAPAMLLYGRGPRHCMYKVTGANRFPY